MPLGDSEVEPSFRRVKTGELLEDKWRIERKLGEGGMGTVWLATDLQLQRNVAVKILSPQLAQDSELVTRFEREAKMTAALEHPNIVPVYAVGHLEDRPFIVMKNLEGLTLSSLIRDRGNLKKDELLPLLKQVAAGLDFIHKKGFIHRDIKSGNIFVSPDGHATILDFGILRSKEGTDALTRTGIVMGTPQYMAPEQALGRKTVDHRVDLYALAVVLYEAVTGTLPFDGESDLSIVQAQAHSLPPDPCVRAPWIPRYVGDVLLQALAKTPDERFPSATALYRALDDAYAGKQVVQGVPPSIPLRPPPIPLTPADEAPIPVNTGDLIPVDPQPPRRRGLKIALGLTVALLAFGGGALAAFWPLSPALEDVTPISPVAAAELDAGSADGVFAETAAADASTELLTDVNGLGDGQDAGEALAENLAEAAIDAGTISLNEVELASAQEPQETQQQQLPQEKKKLLPKGNGKLNVVSTYRGEPYWASVIVNGRKVGNTPVTLSLPSGKHVIRIERAGFRPVERRILVASGRSDVLRIALKP